MYEKHEEMRHLSIKIKNLYIFSVFKKNFKIVRICHSQRIKHSTLMNFFCEDCFANVDIHSD